MASEHNMSLEEALHANQAYVQSEFHKPMKLGVKRRCVVLTCMDSRLHPERFLGLGIGDAEVIRNGGGRVSEDVIRSMIVCQDVLQCDRVFVIHHTDCGAHAALFHPTSALEHLKAKAADWFGGQGGINMQPIYDLDSSIREDVRKLRASEYIRPTTLLYGLAFDTESGKLRPICKDEGIGSGGFQDMA